MQRSEHRPGTPRTRPCDMDLAAFAFELEFDDDEVMCETVIPGSAALCTLHTSWTAAEAHEAYNRKAWICGGAEECEEVCTTRMASPSPRQPSAIVERAPAMAPASRHHDVSPACVDMSLFWSSGSSSSATQNAKHGTVAYIPHLELQATR